MTYVAPVMDETTRTVTARVEVDNPKGALRPGMFAQVEIEIGGDGATVATFIVDPPRTGMSKEALRGVVRQALVQVAEHGLRGNHHLYMSFDTNHPDVVLSDFLRAKYANDMTIVLQHQYLDLKVGNTAFEA